MTTHELKTWPEYFGPLWDGLKTAELRKDDRGFAVGDVLLLWEWEPTALKRTGRFVRVRITHIVRGGEWLTPGYVLLSFRKEDFYD